MTDTLFDLPERAYARTDGVERSARISDCGTYRYTLTRHWGPGQALMFVMLNPSTADALKDDRTIGRCIEFAKREGYDGIVVVNLYALRSTDPAAILTSPDPVGPDNDLYITPLLTERVRRGLPVVAAWGSFATTASRGAFAGRASRVLALVAGVDWRCLGVTKVTAAPRHPLYVRGDQPLIPYPAAA